jgi:hypothetical protein
MSAKVYSKRNDRRIMFSTGEARGNSPCRVRQTNEGLFVLCAHRRGFIEWSAVCPVVSRMGKQTVFNRARVQVLHWQFAPGIDVVGDEYRMKHKAFMSPDGRKVWADAVGLFNAKPKAYRAGQKMKYRFNESQHECLLILD